MICIEHLLNLQFNSRCSPLEKQFAFKLIEAKRSSNCSLCFIVFDKSVIDNASSLIMSQIQTIVERTVWYYYFSLWFHSKQLK